MKKNVNKDGNLKYDTVRTLLISTNELWRKVNQIAKECGVSTEQFLRPGEDATKPVRHYYSPSDVVSKVNKTFGVNVKKQSRETTNVKARVAACFLLRKYTWLSLKDIAKEIGNKEHTSIIYSLNSYQNFIDKDKGYRSIMDTLIANIEKEVPQD